MTIQGALTEIFIMLNDETMPIYFKPSLKKIAETIETERVGHWKKMVEVYDLQQNRMLVPYGYDDAKFGNTPVYVCDCGCESNKNSRFCPDCGCAMKGESE